MIRHRNSKTAAIEKRIPLKDIGARKSMAFWTKTNDSPQMTVTISKLKSARIGFFTL
jgi:hypothetical protein